MQCSSELAASDGWNRPRRTKGPWTRRLFNSRGVGLRLKGLGLGASGFWDLCVTV